MEGVEGGTGEYLDCVDIRREWGIDERMSDGS